MRARTLENFNVTDYEAVEEELRSCSQSNKREMHR
jgi:hypothetical protein